MNLRLHEKRRIFWLAEWLLASQEGLYSMQLISYSRGKSASSTILTINELSTQTICNTRAVWKVRGLTLLLRVGTSWRCGDGLFFEVPPLASDALLTTLHPFLENVLQTVCLKLQEDNGTRGFDILITSKFLASEVPFHGWKSPEIAWGEIWTLWWMF
jgi:hypothetical protein